MGEALLAGLLATGTPASSMGVVEPLAVRRDELSETYGVSTSAELRDSSGVILAVKPHLAAVVSAEMARFEPDRVLSVAAGVTLASLDAVLPNAAVIRAMPNTPALVGQGAAAIAPGANASDADMAWAEGLLTSVGKVVRLTESSLDAVTGLSGSGPAYVFLVAEAMIEAGVLQGLTRDVATTLAVQTLLGASTLLAVGDRSAADLRADVTSPGGTTAAGLRALENHGVRAAFLDAVSSAADRSRELGA
jgi:pyrroline-5-carboxylate reductase